MDELLEFASVDNILRQALAPVASPGGMGPAMPEVQTTAPGPGIAFPATPPPQPLPLPTGGEIPNYTGSGTVKVAPLTPAHLNLFGQLIRKTESDGNYQAKNPHTSASGAYQYVNRTWGNYGGYPEARLAPRAVQDAKFNEDALQKLRKYNGDPFKMIADHMLPAQANKPWLWNQPSIIMNHGKPLKVPPVADYVRKVVKGSPWEGQFEQYLKAQGVQ